MATRVLIIDDSATMRAVLAARLSGQPGIQVVGLASNAAEGRTAIKELTPDVVTLDIEMPGMNGLDFLDKIMTLRPTPVIIVSGLTQAGSDVTAKALGLGAVDCYCKSDFSGNALDDGGKLAAMVRTAAQVTVRSRAVPNANRMQAPLRAATRHGTRIIAIGSSTGGVEALQVLLSDFPEDCPPTMIVQHVDARFAPAIARTLNGVCRAQVVLAEPDTPLRRGMVYLAPGDDRHLLLGGMGTLHAKLRQGEPISGHRPSVDALFHSVAQVAGPNAVGILLTGMGADGAKGLLAMAQAGAHTIAQDEASCTVFGMPRVAISLGAANIVAPLGAIAQHAFS